MPNETDSGFENLGNLPTPSDPTVVPFRRSVPIRRSDPDEATVERDAEVRFPPFDPVSAATRGFRPISLRSRNSLLGPVVLEAVAKKAADGSVLILGESLRVQVVLDESAPIPTRLRGAERARAILSSAIDRRVDADRGDGFSLYSDDLLRAVYSALCDGWGEAIESTARPPKQEEDDDPVDLDRLRRLAEGSEE